MIRRTLKINEVDVTCNPVTYTCYGLGSCIGLFITDRLKELTGGAHIPMPVSTELNQYRDAKKMISDLLKGLEIQGSDLGYLRAKIAGGAKVYESSFSIGAENIKEVLRCLMERKIFIAASDVGGRVSRTARFNSDTRKLEISTSEQKTYCI